MLRSPTVCHLQAGDQENQWHNSAQVPQPSEPGEWMVWILVRGKRIWDGAAPAQPEWKKRGKFPLSLSFVLFGPSADWVKPTHIGEGSTESTDPNADLIWKRPHRHTQKWCLIEPPRPVNLTHKTDRHNSTAQSCNAQLVPKTFRSENSSGERILWSVTAGSKGVPVYQLHLYCQVPLQSYCSNLHSTAPLMGNIINL